MRRRCPTSSRRHASGCRSDERATRLGERGLGGRGLGGRGLGGRKSNGRDKLGHYYSQSLRRLKLLFTLIVVAFLLFATHLVGDQAGVLTHRGLDAVGHVGVLLEESLG